MTRRPKLSASSNKFMAGIKSTFRAELNAKIAAVQPDKVDAILHAVHGGGGVGKTFVQLAEEMGVETVVLLKILRKYTDTVTHYVMHKSIAEAKAFRAKRRASYKAARQWVRERNEEHMRKAAERDATPTPEGSPP